MASVAGSPALQVSRADDSGPRLSKTMLQEQQHTHGANDMHGSSGPFFDQSAYVNHSSCQYGKFVSSCVK